MSKFFLFIFGVLISFHLFSQEPDCKKIRTQKISPKAVENQPSDVGDKPELILKLIQNCISLDSVDLYVMNRDFFNYFFLKHSSDEATYADLINFIEDFKAAPEYVAGRDKIVLRMKYEYKIVDKNDWDEVKVLLEAFGLKEAELSEFKKFAYASKNKALNYVQAFIKFQHQKSKKTKPVKYVGDLFAPMTHLKDMLSKTNPKKQNILLYFTAYADANSHLLEERFFTNPQVYLAIQKNYTAFRGYVDERRKLTSEEKNKLQIQDPNIKTRGAFVYNLEKSIFPEAYQPAFIIVNAQGEIIEHFKYSKNIEDFIEFLERNKN